MLMTTMLIHAFANTHAPPPAPRRVLTMEWVTGVKLTTLSPEEIRSLVKVGWGAVGAWPHRLLHPRPHDRRLVRTEEHIYPRGEKAGFHAGGGWGGRVHPRTVQCQNTRPQHVHLQPSSAMQPLTTFRSVPLSR